MGLFSAFTLADDYGGSMTTAEKLGISSAKKGIINYIGDKDYFQVTAERDGRYELQFEGASDVVVDVYNSSKRMIESGISGSNLKGYDLRQGETYYFVVRSLKTSAVGETAGNYQLSFNQINDDYANSLDKAANMTIGSSINGIVNYNGDKDYFQVKTSKAGRYELKFIGDTNILLDIYDSSKKLIESGVSGNAIKNYNLKQEQTYYFGVKNGQSGAIGETAGKYQLLFNEVPDDYGNSLESAKEINATDNISGRINYAGDVDCFKFTVQNSGWYNMEVSRENQSITYSMKDSTGRSLEMKENGLKGSEVYLEKGKTYYTEFTGVNGTTGDYSGKISYEEQHHFNIEFDYSYDATGFFNDPVRRQNLEYAASLISNFILDDFPTVAAGTEIPFLLNPLTGNRQTVIADKPIDDLLIFVSARDLSSMQSDAYTLGVSAPSGAKANEQRYMGPDFEPWAGSITFNNKANWFFDSTVLTDNDIPSTSTDFIRVATHEILHVLGIGPSTAFQNLIIGNTYFIGENAVAENGGWVPVDQSLTHLDRTEFPNDLMNPYASSGSRAYPSQLDKAILKDIGYQIA